MRAAIAAAEVGDEQLGEDPTVNELQRRIAGLLGHEAALFLPTATMANQIALRTLTQPGGMLIAEERTHVLIYEAGGPAVHSGLVMRGLPGVAGRASAGGPPPSAPNPAEPPPARGGRPPDTPPPAPRPRPPAPPVSPPAPAAAAPAPP